jgi:excisionase family DNA binding protein
MSDPYLLTLGQAAKQVKVAKSTLTRAIQKGELSCKEKTETGGYRIDPAELDRWNTTRPKQPSQDDEAGPSETPIATLATALLEQEVEHLKKLVEVEKRRADTAEEDRDQWRKQAQTLALAAPIPQPAPQPTPASVAVAPPAPMAKPRRGLLGWLLKSPAD